MKGRHKDIRGPIIFDTSALFNFGHRGEMDFLLKNLKKEYKLIVPPSVKEQTQMKTEFKQYYQKLITDYFDIKTGRPSSLSIETFKALVQKLGDVDVEVIVLGLDTKGTIIMDDRKARKESEALGIHVIGTVGLIDYSIQRNWLTSEEAIQIVRRLIERGSRIPLLKDRQTFQEYINSIGE